MDFGNGYYRMEKMVQNVQNWWGHMENVQNKADFLHGNLTIRASLAPRL